MIQAAGETWGTAREIADHLGGGVTEDNVRRWAARCDLDSVRVKGRDGRPQVWYALNQVVLVERGKRLSGRGRPRAELDTV